MFNITNKKSIIVHITTGFFNFNHNILSNVLFSSLGSSGKIPVNLSIFFPLLILSIICTIGLININENKTIYLFLIILFFVNPSYSQDEFLFSRQRISKLLITEI